jgi:hypothetical protein
MTRVASVARLSPGGIRRGISLCAREGGASIEQERRMRRLMAATAAVAMIIVSHASAQTCLRPKWTECVSFPNGGRHTGVSPYGVPVQLEVPAGAEICVSNEWEIRAETYAQFARNGTPWPNRDWEVDVDTFCFYKN